MVGVSDLTWGLDVSTNEAKTAAVALDWSMPGEARVVQVRRPVRAVDIAPLISEYRGSSWAVDVPFGWPDPFVALMVDRHHGPLPVEAMPVAGDWKKWRTRQVAQRLTDRFLTDDPRIKTRPPSGVIPVARRDGRDVGLGGGRVGHLGGRDRPCWSRGQCLRDLSLGGSIGVGVR